MLSVYICEDEEEVRRIQRECLEKQIMIQGYDMEIALCSGRPGEILEAVEKNPGRGIYFLDVELKDGEWDGFRLGRELRRRDPHGTLVYITSYGDLAWRTFQYHLEAFDYIVKAQEQTGPSAARCLEAIHGRLMEERRDPAEVFSLRMGEEIRHVPLADILFFETGTKAHHVLLHTAHSRMDFVGSLNELEAELGGRFVRVHRAFLAAADKIEAVEWKKNRVRVGGQECLLSRAGKAELKKRLGESR